MYDWIDEFEISNLADLDSRWNVGKAQAQLLTIAQKSLNSSRPVVPSSGAVVAGLGLDLSSSLTCTNYACRANVAESEYSQILHYFDCVVMEGPSAANYIREIASISTRDLANRFEALLRSDVQLMLHLRNMGLSNYILFAPRSAPRDQTEFIRLLADLGVGDIANDAAVLNTAKSLSRAGAVRVVQIGHREWGVSLSGPQFFGLGGKSIYQKTKPKKVEAAAGMISRQLREMVIDATTARDTASALASINTPEFFDVDRESRSLTVDDVALRVYVPVLQGLSTSNLIRLRESEREHFERFQLMLFEAIEETMNERGSDSPDAVAERVWRTKIKPQAVELERRILASDRAIKRKLTAGVSIGAASAAIGSLVGVLTATVGSGFGAALGAAAGTVSTLPTIMPFFSKRIEEKQQFETSDSYFLWKASQFSSHHQ